ncbi:hypothetical protein CF70_002935 [Cupriavidus sp. SK-3]|nr:hypothetical protein CF70_002935 [Cupriavidus sp. SK-3]
MLPGVSCTIVGRGGQFACAVGPIPIGLALAAGTMTHRALGGIDAAPGIDSPWVAGVAIAACH